MNKMKIQFGYSLGARIILFGDLIAFLYSQGATDLAEELIERGEVAFKELDERKATYNSGKEEE